MKTTSQKLLRKKKKKKSKKEEKNFFCLFSSQKKTKFRLKEITPYRHDENDAKFRRTSKIDAAIKQIED